MSCCGQEQIPSSCEVPGVELPVSTFLRASGPGKDRAGIGEGASKLLPFEKPPTTSIAFLGRCGYNERICDFTKSQMSLKFEPDVAV